MAERWGSQLLRDIDPLEWDDFLALSDAVHEINTQEAKAYKAAQGR